RRASPSDVCAGTAAPGKRRTRGNRRQACPSSRLPRGHERRHQTRGDPSPCQATVWRTLGPRSWVKAPSSGQAHLSVAGSRADQRPRRRLYCPAAACWQRRELGETLAPRDRLAQGPGICCSCGTSTAMLGACSSMKPGVSDRRTRNLKEPGVFSQCRAKDSLDIFWLSDESLEESD